MAASAASSPAHGFGNYREHLVEKALALRLAEDAQWLKLMYYHVPLLSADALVSYVDDPKFFLAAEGKTQPEKELVATLQGLFNDSAQGNEHPACRFPARRDWLLQRLDVDPSQLPAPACVDYESWRATVNATSLTLIFPSAYINSPSSMFGHTLFRFDPENVEEGTDWLSWSLSFGANIDASDNSIAFAYRGIFGGYTGIYTMMHYFRKIQEYNHLENRDIWEYDLDVSAAQVDVMLAHIWELKDTRFDYYFLDENCAFRLLELVELVRPDVNLTGRFGMTAIPADTVRAFADEGLVTAARFKPSATTEISSRIAELSNSEAQLARALSDDIGVLQSAAYQSLAAERKAQVVQVAYSFLRYRQLKMVRDPALAQRSHQLLTELSRLPADRHQVQVPQRPEEGHRTRMIGASAGVAQDQSFAQLDFRVTYHDLLDNPVGYPKGAHIAMGNTRVRLTEGDDLRLERFDFIDIVSLSAIDAFFVSPSWHVKTGYEQVNAGSSNAQDEHRRTGAYYVKAGGGVAMDLAANTKVYAFADARIENNSRYKTFITPATGLSAGVLGYLPFGNLQAGVESDYFYNDAYRLRFSAEQNIVLDTHQAIRIGYFNEWYRGGDSYEAYISFRHHF
jgi:hypothetical protein